MISNLTDLSVLLAIKKSPKSDRSTVSFVARQIFPHKAYQHPIALGSLDCMIALGYVTHRDYKHSLTEAGHEALGESMESFAPFINYMLGD